MMNGCRIKSVDFLKKDCQMKTLEISVTVDNSGESLVRISRLLGAANVNMKAVSVCQSDKQQMIRLIVERPEIAVHILKDAGFQVKETTVLAIALDDRPGAMAEILELLGRNSLNPEYLYSILSGRDKMADIIFKLSDPDTGESLLTKFGYSAPQLLQ